MTRRARVSPSFNHNEAVCLALGRQLGDAMMEPLEASISLAERDVIARYVLPSAEKGRKRLDVYAP